MGRENLKGGKKVKKLFLFLCAGLFFSVSAVFAEQIMVNEDGEAWLINDAHQWEVASEAEVQAYQHPGVEVPVDLRTGKPKKVDFFHYVPVQEYSEVIVWNGEKFQTIKKEGEEYGEPKLAGHIILLLVAVIFMALSNVAVRVSQEIPTLLAATVTIPAIFVAATVSMRTGFSTIAFIAFIAAVFAFLASVLIIIIDFGNEGEYKMLSTIFYFLSFLSIAVWIYG